MAGKFRAIPELSPRAETRFWAKVDKHGPIMPSMDTPCWVWNASLKPEGYGQFQFDGIMQQAHRVSKRIELDRTPEQLDHLCSNRQCVNPEHLEEATQKVNFSRGQHPSAIAVRTGKCKRGHDIIKPGSYYLSKSGSRDCKKCQISSAARRASRTKRCAVIDCDRAGFTKGYCRTHYSRLWKHGDVMAHIPIANCGRKDSVRI